MGETPIKKHKEKKCKKTKENGLESEEKNCQLEKKSKEKKQGKLAKKLIPAEQENDKLEGNLENSIAVIANDANLVEKDDEVNEDVETDTPKKSMKKKRKEVKSEADIGSAKKSKKI